MIITYSLQCATVDTVSGVVSQTWLYTDPTDSNPMKASKTFTGTEDQLLTYLKSLHA